MYTGTLIEDLIATVKRAETSPRLDPKQEDKLTYWYELVGSQLANCELAGVA